MADEEAPGKGGYWEDGTPMNHPRPPAHERVVKLRMVWEFKKSGKTFPWIAEEMGISQSTAHKYFKEAYRMQAPPAAEQERVMAIQQLDELYSDAREAYDSIADPLDKLKALTVMDKILKSRRELMGLDAPTKFQGVVHNTDSTELELAQMIAEEKARNAEREAELRRGAPVRTRRRKA